MSLYTFESTSGATNEFKFNICGKSGRVGPTLAECRASYGGSGGEWWNDNTNNWLNMTTNGIQQWKPPVSGTYEISVKGADGGYGSGAFAPSGGGGGAFVKINVELTNTDYINIVCGQTSSTTPADSSGSGGGGGTWVYKGSIGGNGLIVVAGGGGGWGHGHSSAANKRGLGLGGNDTGKARGVTSQTALIWSGNASATVYSNGTVDGTPGGTSSRSISLGGLGIDTGTYGGGGGGAGWVGVGGNPTSAATSTQAEGGQRWIGGRGKSLTTTNTSMGGFGGGGGGGGNGIGPGGGGGYTGGGAGNTWASVLYGQNIYNSWGAGGGGGSAWKNGPHIIDTHFSDTGTTSLVQVTKGLDGIINLGATPPDSWNYLDHSGYVHIKLLITTSPINGSNITLLHLKEQYIDHGTTDAEGHDKLTALYGFQSHTFTNCGASGRYGPTLTDCMTTYGSSGNWWNDTDYFDVLGLHQLPSGHQVVSGIQIWTVPHTGNYKIEAVGASGGDNNNTSSAYGGKGAAMDAVFSLLKGDKYLILIGLMGLKATGSSQGGSGGGGTFFVSGSRVLTIPPPYPITTHITSTNQLLIAAGGGGGAAGTTGGNALSSGYGTDGTGGAGSSTAGGGGGLLGHGSNTWWGGGRGFHHGAVSHDSMYYPQFVGTHGGFGGGGGTSSNYGGGGGGCFGGDGGDSGSPEGEGGGSHIDSTGSSGNGNVTTTIGHGYLTVTALDSPGIKLSYFDGATFTDHTSVYRPISMSEFKNKTFGFSNKITPDKWRFYSRYSNNSTYLMGDLPGVNGKPNTRASLSQPQAPTPDYFTMFISYNNSSGVSPGIIVDRLSPKCIDEATIWMKVVSWNNYIPTMLGLIKKDYDKATWDDQIGINAMDTISGSFGDRFCFVTRGYHTYAGSRDDIVGSPITNASFTDESVGPYNGPLTKFFHNRYGVTQGTQLTSSCQSVSNNITASPSTGWATRFLDTTSTNLPGYPGFSASSILPYIGLKLKWYETTIQASLQNNWHVILNPNGSGTSWTSASLTDVFSGMYVSGTGIPDNTLIGDIYSNYMIMYQEQNTESVYTKLPVQNATSTETNVTLTINGYLYWTLTTDPHTAYENPKYIGPPHTVLPRYQFTSGGAYQPTTEWAFYIGDTTSGTTNDFKYDIVDTEPKSSAGERFSYGPITYNASTSPDQPTPQSHEFALNPYLPGSSTEYIIQGSLSGGNPAVSGISLRNPPYWTNINWYNYSMGALYKFTVSGNIVALGVMNRFESHLGLYYNGTNSNSNPSAQRVATCTVSGNHSINAYRYMTLSSPQSVTAGQYYWVVIKNYEGGYSGHYYLAPPFPAAQTPNSSTHISIEKFGHVSTASSPRGLNTTTSQLSTMSYPVNQQTNYFYGNTDLIFVPS